MNKSKVYKLCSIALFITATAFFSFLISTFNVLMSLSGRIVMDLVLLVIILACLLPGIKLWKKASKDKEPTEQNTSKRKMIGFLLVAGILGLMIGLSGERSCVHHWQAATCTTPQTCSLCGTDKGNALGHTVNEWTVTQEPTCLAAGSSNGTCSVCKEVITKYISKKDHSPGKWVVETEPTCLAEGSRNGTCSVCKEAITESIDKTDHTPGKWVVETEPTSATDGEKVLYCSVCNEKMDSEKITLSAEEKEELFKEECKTYTYEEIARNPGDYTGDQVKFTGQVIQVIESGNECNLRVNITEESYYWSDTIYVTYTKKDSSESRILEDDIVTLYGFFAETVTYETVMGASVTIPAVAAVYIDID